MFILLLCISYLFIVYNNAKKTVDEKMHNPIEIIDTEQTKGKLSATEPLTLLLLGIDSTGGQAGRSDALMVMRLNPTAEKLTIVSIPRDTRTKIIGRNIDDKINHAHAFGGAHMAVATVENLLNIKIDYYVSMNMEGLVELVDELGTITINNEVAWSDNTNEFPQGTIELDGEQTIAYVRMRKQDPSGDFGRTKRQRKVIVGIINQGIAVGSIPRISGMINILGENMSTNMDFSDMKKLFLRYRETRKNIQEHMLNGTAESIDGIYYLIVPKEEIERAHSLLTTSN